MLDTAKKAMFAAVGAPVVVGRQITDQQGLTSEQRAQAERVREAGRRAFEDA